jgi:CheY-like chemotaxis protein
MSMWRMRGLPGLNRVRLVALTGYGHADDLGRARDAGFDDHLVKPVDFATLGRCMAATPDGASARRTTQ